MSNPLESYFDEDHPRPDFRARSSANWRGYVAEWEVRDDTLYLVALRGWIGGENERYAVEATEVGLGDLFEGGAAGIEATWYSGILRLPQGRQIEYVHFQYESVYERDLLLTFEHGKLVRQEIRDNHHLIAKIEKRQRQKRREILGLPWGAGTGGKLLTVLVIAGAILILPVVLAYLIHKYGWNPKRWRLTGESDL